MIRFEDFEAINAEDSETLADRIDVWAYDILSDLEMAAEINMFGEQSTEEMKFWGKVDVFSKELDDISTSAVELESFKQQSGVWKHVEEQAAPLVMEVEPQVLILLIQQGIQILENFMGTAAFITEILKRVAAVLTLKTRAAATVLSVRARASGGRRIQRPAAAGNDDPYSRLWEIETEIAGIVKEKAAKNSANYKKELVSSKNRLNALKRFYGTFHPGIATELRTWIYYLEPGTYKLASQLLNMMTPPALERLQQWRVTLEELRQRDDRMVPDVVHRIVPLLEKQGSSGGEERADMDFDQMIGSIHEMVLYMEFVLRVSSLPKSIKTVPGLLETCEFLLMHCEEELEKMERKIEH